MEKYPVGTLGIGPGIDWVLTRTQAREQVCTMCPSRLSGRPSRSITSLQQGRSGRLSRRPCGVTPFCSKAPQLAKSGLVRCQRTPFHGWCRIPSFAALRPWVGCRVARCLFQKKDILFFRISNVQPDIQPIDEVLQIMGWDPTWEGCTLAMANVQPSISPPNAPCCTKARLERVFD